ncbi:DUF2271 domain-containing protein [Kangiella spongicola]|uniref:DUF2271 domain-containing protein n=1 Tax=Kangiella spongicola TaxID=796379 RepID=A0A318D4V4_9GAMM|nr:DUF2271 domain-containing protein [Kangiella spongicola]PXF63921.1 DUF2271 domain-containing protein [Kangiella spongicola]
MFNRQCFINSKKLLAGIFLFTLSISAKAVDKGEFVLTITIPKKSVVEYHAPYIATWIENDKRKTVASTSLWYDDQEKWLKDIRRWWRKTGRSQKKPYDGVTGATRRPGEHQLVLRSEDTSELLEDGDYVLYIEAAREVGGREVLSLPFSWPITESTEVSASGENELGKVTLTISPR